MNTKDYFKDGIYNRIIDKLFGQKGFISAVRALIFSLVFLYVPQWLLNVLDATIHGFERIGYYKYNSDYAAVIQLLIVFPLYIYARKFISIGWYRIQEHMNETFVNAEDLAKLEGKLDRIQRIFFSKWLEGGMILISFSMTILTLHTDAANGVESWYTLFLNGKQIITFAGYYAWYLVLPIFINMTVYWIRAILLWVIILFLLSRTRMVLNAYHPDMVCGLGFFSETITGFSILIFAQGIMQVATFYYRLDRMSLELTMENMDIWLLLYVIFAPILFTLPLTFYTMKITRCKRSAIKELRSHIHDLTFGKTDISNEVLVDVKDLKEVHDTLNSIRVWPIDIVSLAKLFVSAILPGLPIIINLLDLNLPNWIVEILGL